MERVSAGLHLILYTAEIVLQVLTAVWNIGNGMTYCWLVVAFIVLSSLITNSVSLAWVYKSMDFTDRRTGECLCISLHTFQLGIPWRYLKLWLAGDRKDYEELVVLRLIQASIQSGPFLVLQTWLTLDTNYYSRLSMAALGVSLVSLAYTYASNTEPLHQVLHVHPDSNSSLIQFATRFFFHCFIMVARFLAIAIFGLLTRSWLVLALIAHFVIATITMIIHNMWKPPHNSKPNKVIIWTSMQSYACTFSPVPFSRMSYPYLLYFIVIFLENLVMSTVWFIQRASTSENVVLYTLSLTSFLTGFVIACLYSKTLNGFSRNTSEELSTVQKPSTEHTSTQSNQRNYIVDETRTERSEAIFVLDINNAPRDAEPKTSSLLSLGIHIEQTDGVSALDDLDEVIPSPFFLQDVLNCNAWDSIDSGVDHSQTLNDSVQRTNSMNDKKMRNGNMMDRQTSFGSISSGCCTDTSVSSATVCKLSHPSKISFTKQSPNCSSVTKNLHSTPKVSVIEITEEERMLIDSLLRTGECLLDGQDGELSSSGCFGESSSEHSSSGCFGKSSSEHMSNKLSFNNCADQSGATKVENSVEVTNARECGASIVAQEPQESVSITTPEVLPLDYNCEDSDVFSTTYQTISSCPSDYPQLDRKLPSLTSSVTRTWADAALSSSTSTCDTCTTCRESFESSCSDSMSWSSSQDTLNLLESDTDCMTWPPRKVNIVNLHDLPREKLSLDDRISKWLGEVTMPPRHRRTTTTKPKGSLSPVHQNIPKKLVYINPQTIDCNTRLKRTKPVSLFNVTPPRVPKKQVAPSKRPLSRSHSLNFLMKLCKAASLRRKKVILFNHLREECQRHRDPFSSRFPVS